MKSPHLLLLAAALARPFSTSAADALKFNRDIRPILSDKCFFCHGPDSKKREADLRLDVREVAVEADAIVPGKPDESEMIARILSTTPKEHMPPAEAPGIDPLVAKGLAARGLKPQPEADRHTLIRRVSFDLTGLPPTPAEIETFVKDAAPNAYEKLVDRLLASPRYGERMAVDWLDVSRYADSYGFQVDREREVWPWRDWVIRAFNDNLSFDKFITWQLAGDLLPNPTDDQILATAFNRLHQQEAEGGSVEEEYRVEYVADRVQTFSTVFLGLTFECARCHDHKFDPITHKDYYQLFSLFQNIDEAGLYSYFTESPPTPAHAPADAPAKQRLAALQQAATDAEKQLATLREAKRDAFVAWLPSRPTEVKLPGELGGFGFEWLDKDKLANWIDPAQPATLKGENKLVPGSPMRASGR